MWQLQNVEEEEMDPEMALQARGDKEEEKAEANNVSKVRLIEKLFDWIHIGFD